MKFTYLFICLLMAPSVAIGEYRIRITNGEWPPYLSQKLPYQGYASHIVKEAFSAVGMSVEYGFFPWKRAYKYAKRGKSLQDGIWHGTLVWSYTEEREKDFYFSDVVINDSQVLFHLKSNPLKWEVIEDLYGKKIGGTLHTSYPELKVAVNRGILQLEQAGTYSELFNRLLIKRIDAIPQVKQVAEFFIRTQLSSVEQAKISYSPTVLSDRKYYLILTKSIEENKKTIELFNKGLTIIKENGLYDDLKNNLNLGLYYSTLK